MNLRYFFTLAFVLFLSLTVFGSITAVNVMHPNSGGTYSGTISLTFTVQAGATDEVHAHLAHSDGGLEFDNDIESNVNLNNHASEPNLDCTSTDWSITPTCTYSWDASSLDLASVYFDVNIWDVNGVIPLTDAADTSSTDFIIDNNPPTTSDDAPSGWQTTVFTVNLTCEDDGSGCDQTGYRINDGAWTVGAPPIAININTDGTFEIDYNSTDNNGQIETTNTVTVYLDQANPWAYITQPDAGEDLISDPYANLEFDLNDPISGIDTMTMTLKKDGSLISNNFDFDDHCTAVDDNFNCAYTEYAIDEGGLPYTITIEALDNAGNSSGISVRTFDYIDDDAPATPSAPSCDPGDEDATIEWNKSSENDMKSYDLHRGTSSGFTPGSGNKEYTRQHSDCGSECSYEDTGLDNGEVYYYKVIAKDISGNSSSPSAASNSCSPEEVSAPNKPEIESNVSDGGYTNDDINFHWDDVSGATSYYYRMDGSSGTDVTTSNKDGTTTNNSLDYDIDDLSEGTHYFHLAAYKGGMLSDSDHYTIRVDTASPSKPSDLTATAESDGDIRLEWDKSTSGDVSNYYIYQSTSSSVPQDDEVGITSSSSYTRKYTKTPALISGKKYYFVVVAKDHSGNYSAASNVASVTPNKAEIQVSLDVPEFAGTNEFEIKATLEGGTLSNGTLYVKLPGKVSFISIATSLSGASISHKYKFPSGTSGSAQIKLEGTASNGAIVLEIANITVDSELPLTTIITPSENAKLKGTVELRARATDKNGEIKNVSFSYGDIVISVVTEGDTDEYSTQWDTTKVKDGPVTLKVVAIDKAGNIAARSVSITIENATPEEIAAKEAQENAGNKKSLFKSNGIELPEEFAQKMEEAEKLISEGKWTEAEQLFKELVSSYVIEEIESMEYSYDKDSVDELLEGIVLNENLKTDAENLLRKNPTKRALVLIKVEENGQTFYRVAVKLTISNSEKAQTFKVVEIVPKQIAQKASELFSESSFKILNDDPVLQFTVSVPDNGSQTIVYSLSKNLDKATAESMLDNIDAYFAVPPLLFSGESEPAEEDFAQQGFFDFGIVLIAIGVLIALALVGGLIFYVVKMRGGDSGKGYGGPPSSGFDFKEKKSIGGRISGLFGGKKGKGGGRWSYDS